MPPRAPAQYRAAVAESSARLARLMDARGAASIRRMFDEAHRDLERRLARLGTGSMSAHQARVLLAQVKLGISDITHRMAQALGTASRDAQTQSLDALVADITRLERKFTGAEITLPLEEAATFRGLIEGRRSSLLAAHASSMARYGAAVVQKTEETVSRSLMAGEATDETIDRVMDVTGGSWPSAERVVRTELAWSYSSAAADGMKRAAVDLPDLMMRWSEHVDDVSYAPLDDRVAVDSIAMHGQLATPGGVFTMPPTAPAATRDGVTEVPEALVGGTWEFPPCRPNGREVLAPWREGWGVPGWIWRGRRVPYRGGGRHGG